MMTAEQAREASSSVQGNDNKRVDALVSHAEVAILEATERGNFKCSLRVNDLGYGGYTDNEIQQAINRLVARGFEVNSRLIDCGIYAFSISWESP